MASSTSKIGTILAACVLAGSLATQASDRMAWWREARFGLLLHWGLYSIPAGQWDGLSSHDAQIMDTAQIPLERYAGLRSKFDPTAFDANAWARIAKRAGVKYVIVTAKHHDGFCLFDSKATDYDIMSTPFRRDVMKELAEACRREGLKIGWSYSIMDWHHPDYLPRREWEQRSADGADFARYVAYVRAQVKELLTGYGDIAVMWFDGEWEATWTHDHGLALLALCRELQPDIIVNNRVDKGRVDATGMTRAGVFAGDFGTPKQRIPRVAPGGDADWEAALTITQHWSHNAKLVNHRGPQDIIRSIVDVASKGGNLLLNVGPTAAGEIPSASVAELETVGRWLETNGESVRGVRQDPLDPNRFGRCTVRPDGDTTRLYLHVFRWVPDSELVVAGISNELIRARLLGDGTKLETRREGPDIHVKVPDRPAPDGNDTVVVLDLDGSLDIVPAPRFVSEVPFFVTAMDVELQCDAPDVEVRYTLDGSPPGDDSPRYEKPIRVAGMTVMRARAYRDGRAVSGMASRIFRKVEPNVPLVLSGIPLAPGLRCKVYERVDRPPNFQRDAARMETAARIELPEDPGQRIAREFDGFIQVPHDEVYVFTMVADDAARLLIDREVVINDDGRTGAAESRGAIALAAGYHNIIVQWFNRSGAGALEVRVARIGEQPQPIPAAALQRMR